MFDEFIEATKTFNEALERVVGALAEVASIFARLGRIFINRKINKHPYLAWLKLFYLEYYTRIKYRKYISKNRMYRSLN